MTMLMPPRYLKALFQCMKPTRVQLPDQGKMASQLDPIVISDSDDNSSDSEPEKIGKRCKVSYIAVMWL